MEVISGLELTPKYLYLIVIGLISFVLIRAFMKIRLFFWEELLDPRLTRWLSSLRQVVNRDKNAYFHLTAKFIRSQNIYGLKDFVSLGKLDDIYIDIPVGVLPRGFESSASLTDNLGGAPIRSKSDPLTVLKHTNATVLIILGGPGSGKSTLINHMLKKAVKKRDPLVVPIPIIARELDELFAGGPVKMHLAEVVQHYYDRYVCEKNKIMPIDWLQAQVELGNCMIFVDGLDELEEKETRLNFIQWLQKEVRRYGRNRFVITSRPQGLEGKSFQNCQIRYICPLGDDEVKDFVRHWYEASADEECNRRYPVGGRLTQVEEDEKRDAISTIAHQYTRKSDGFILRVMNGKLLRELSRRPMILTMMLIVHMNGNTLPERRCALFDNVLAVMLGGRNDGKGLLVRISPAIKLHILSIVSFRMIEGGIKEIGLDEISHIVSEVGCNYSDVVDCDVFIGEVVRGSGIMVETRKNYYSYCHESFKDYLAACYMLQSDDFGSKRLGVLVQEERWVEPVLLLSGMMDSSSLVLEIVDRKDERSIEFLIRILEEAKFIDGKVRQISERKLRALSSSKDPKVVSLVGGVMLKKRVSFLGGGSGASVDCSLVGNIEMKYFRHVCYGTFGSEDEVLESEDRNGSAMVSKSEALLFCWWLTRFQGDGWQYRLPRIQELNVSEEEVWINEYPSRSIEISSSVIDSVESAVYDSLLEIFDISNKVVVRSSHLSGSFHMTQAKLASEAVERDIKKILTLKDQNISNGLALLMSFVCCVFQQGNRPSDFMSLLAAVPVNSAKDLHQYTGVTSIRDLEESGRKLRDCLASAIVNGYDNYIFGYDLRHLAFEIEDLFSGSVSFVSPDFFQCDISLFLKSNYGELTGLDALRLACLVALLKAGDEANYHKILSVFINACLVDRIGFESCRIRKGVLVVKDPAAISVARNSWMRSN